MCTSLTPDETASDSISSTTLTTSPVTSPATSSSISTWGAVAAFFGVSVDFFDSVLGNSSGFAFANAPARSSFGAP